MDKKYKISKVINITKPITTNGRVIISSTSEDNFYITANNIIIKNIEFNGNNISPKAIRFDGSKNVILENLNMHDYTANNSESRNGIYLIRCNGVTISKCNIYDIKATSQSVNLCQGIDINNSYNINVNFCNIYNIICDINTTEFEGDAIHTLDDKRMETIYDIIISDYIFGNCSKRCLKLQRAGIIVKNCTFSKDINYTNEIIACFHNDISLINV